MCICPTRGLKIGLLILIPIAALFNVAQTTGDIPILKFLSGYHLVMVYIGLVMCLVVVVVMIIGFYATIRNKFNILLVMLAVLVVHCIIKLVIIFVVIFGPRYPEKRITHILSLACHLFSILCMVANILFCVRLREISRAEILRVSFNT